MKFKLFYEVADDETREGDVAAFHSFQPHHPQHSPSHSSLAFCISTLYSLTLPSGHFQRFSWVSPVQKHVLQGSKYHLLLGLPPPSLQT